MASALAPPAQAAAAKQQELMANLLSQPHIAARQQWLNDGDTATTEDPGNHEASRSSHSHSGAWLASEPTPPRNGGRTSPKSPRT